jgi:hypothetical protein
LAGEIGKAVAENLAEMGIEINTDDAEEKIHTLFGNLDGLLDSHSDSKITITGDTSSAVSAINTLT